MLKSQTDKSTYKSVVLKVAIIICWLLLLTCFCFKLFGSKVFNIVVENQRFIKACEWLDGEGLWLEIILMLITSNIANTLVLLASSLTPKPTWKLMLIIIVINCTTFGIKFANSIAAFVIECVVFAVFPAIVSKKWWTGFVGLALNILFQVLSMFIRGADLAETVDTNTIMSLVMLIDYYIMLVLYYLYICAITAKKQ